MIIDTQSVRVAAGAPKETTGLDANKKTPGRKRGPAVDVMGLIIGVVVLAASAHDNEAGIALLDQPGGPAVRDAPGEGPGRSGLQGLRGHPRSGEGHYRRGSPTQPRRPGQRLRPAIQAVGGRAGQRHPHAAAAPRPRTTTGSTTRPPASTEPPPPACSAAPPPPPLPGGTTWSWSRERLRTPTAPADRTR
ncbi:transposase [Streptomyces sp. 8L]|nr:transposase [Streptomyces sp. 8L]